MKTALIQAPVWGTREPPLGLVQLSGCLKSRGLPVKSFDLNNFLYRNRFSGVETSWAWEQSGLWYESRWVDSFFREFSGVISDFTERILEYGPGIAGFSVSSSTYQASIRLAKILRERSDKVTLILGGPAFIDKQFIERAFRESPADFLIQGEADNLFPRLVKSICQGKDPGSVRGLYFRKGDGTGYTGPEPPVENLDKLPYLDFSDLRIDGYDDKVHISMMSSRGCVWKCVFCSTRAFSSGYRSMSAERMHQEITWHRINHYDRERKDNMEHVDFADLEINGDPGRLEEFCELMIKYPPCSFLPEMKWVANAIVHPSLTRGLLRKMAFAGCKKLIFGLESGSDRVLRLMRKQYDPALAMKVIRDAWEAGIEVTANFMFGFPGETREDFQKTLDFIKETGKYLERVYPSRTCCAVEEHSVLHKDPERFGIRTPVEHHLYWETIDGENTYPLRVEKCAEFERFCLGIGVRVDRGVGTTVEMDRLYSLGFYYDYMGNSGEAARYFQEYLKADPDNSTVRKRLRELKGDTLPDAEEENRK